MVYMKQLILFAIIAITLCDRQVLGSPFGSLRQTSGLFGSILGGNKDSPNKLPGLFPLPSQAVSNIGNAASNLARPLDGIVESLNPSNVASHISDAVDALGGGSQVASTIGSVADPGQYSDMASAFPGYDQFGTAQETASQLGGSVLETAGQ